METTEPTREDPDMDHRAATSELNGLFAVAQDAVGGEWEVSDGGAEPCGLPSGESGAQFGFARFGAGVPLDEQQAIVDIVVAAWTEQNLSPTVGSDSLEKTEYTTIRYPESGWGVDGLYLDFRLGEHGAAMLGQTRCVPGDYLAINKELIVEPTPMPVPPPAP